MLNGIWNTHNNLWKKPHPENHSGFKMRLSYVYQKSKKAAGHKMDLDYTLKIMVLLVWLFTEISLFFRSVSMSIESIISLSSSSLFFSFIILLIAIVPFGVAVKS